MPGAWAITAKSAGENEPIDSEAPDESTMARSGWSSLSTECITPSPTPSSDSITAITVATPITVTSEAPAREGRAARFIALTAQISRKRLMEASPLAAGQGVDDGEAHAAHGGWQAADQRQRDGQQQPHQQHGTGLDVEADAGLDQR